MGEKGIWDLGVAHASGILSFPGRRRREKQNNKQSYQQESWENIYIIGLTTTPPTGDDITCLKYVKSLRNENFTIYSHEFELRKIRTVIFRFFCM